MAVASNDPYSVYQWYLDRIDAWGVMSEYSGQGVFVGVYDEGVDLGHADLRTAVDHSRDFVRSGVVYSGGINAEQSGTHGTSVAGIIAADGSNGIGTIGLSHDAKIGSVGVLGEVGSYLIDAMKWQAKFDVTNHSWGWINKYSDGGSFGVSFQSALKLSADTGRGGLGTIQVNSAGNSASIDFDTNMSGFSSSRHTITVAASTDRDNSPSSYSNAGSSVLVSAPSNGGGRGIATLDVTGSGGYASGDITTSFGGTSAAAPIVSGVVGLMLDASDNRLGWRDVQEILAGTADHAYGDLTGAPSAGMLDAWSINRAGSVNGGGYHFSNDLGFGMVDAYEAVRWSEVWSLFGPARTSANEASVAASGNAGGSAIPNGSGSLTFGVTLTGSLRVEHLDLSLTLTHQRMGDLRIELVSPDGTNSLVMRPDASSDVIGKTNFAWTYGSEEFRGEMAAGQWTVRITDVSANGYAGSLGAWSLKAYGETESANDTYHFNDELAKMTVLDPSRSVIADTDGGTDWLNFSAMRVSVDADLSRTSVLVAGGPALSIATGSVIENVVTGDGDDVLRGDGAANHLVGMRGNDLLGGGRGFDILDGGDGWDTALLDGLTGAGFDVFRYGGDVYALDRSDRSYDRITNVEAFSDSAQTVGFAALASFDPLAYAASCDDFARLFGTNAEAALDHYLTTGFHQGRTVSFEASAYLANYGDLRAAFGTDETAARNHFLNNGVHEHRLADDPLDYIASFGDLIGAFTGRDMTETRALGLQHYRSYGHAEGRRDQIDFDADQYLRNYADLRSVFGDDDDLAALHYIQYGYREHRLWADPLDYVASFGDLILAFGGLGVDQMVETAKQHFSMNGFAEGRLARVDFDADAYLASNEDLRALFADGAGGYDEDAATLHYIQIGYAEGRVADYLV